MKTNVRRTPFGAALLIALALVLCGGVADAVESMLWGISYQVSVPMGKTADFTDKVSWRGIGLDGRHYLDDSRSVGLAVSWNVFHEKSYRTETSDDGALTGTQFRDINAVPILATGHWYFGDRWGWRPYVGGGLGLLYAHQRLDVGLWRQDTDSWLFAVAPETGVLFPYDRFLGFAGVRWNYAAGSKELPAQSYVTFMVGFGLR